jgi:glycine/D-amino acid oxidase-like deaminating enzyme/nitrite reductase/ring-hydroxylating ferredoxin subunit
MNMELSKEESNSIWQTDTEFTFSPALSSHQTADVCVIGGGISGLSVAYQLLREGRSVVVLDRASLGLGQTGLTSAHLASALDEGFVTLRKLHGKDGARLAAESHRTAIDEIERIVSREGIECGFQRLSGYLFLSPDTSMEDLQEELDASLEAGMPGVEILENAPISLFSTGPCIRYSGQAQLHPLRYLAGLARSIRSMGGKIYPHTEATSVEGGKPARVATSRGFQVVCGSIVVASNTPFNDRVTMHTKMAPYRTYVVGMHLKEQISPEALLWDTADPYHYIRFTQDPVSGGPVMILGGEDHRTGQHMEDSDRFEMLRKWATDRLKLEAAIAYHWSGQVIEPHDGLAYIGQNPGDEENVYIVTGDSGHGLTHGTIAGMLLRDLILGRENRWSGIYEPSRVNLRSLNTYLKENVHSTAPYGDWLSPGDVSSIQEIKLGEGAVIRNGLQKLAVYKDSFGRVHMCSAVCPHLNGIVRWNSVEKTWDCPCHGSRFDRTGKVINGPSATGLREVVDTSIKEGESASA